MRILVTGSNGFVGNHLMQELALNGHEVTGVKGTSTGTTTDGQTFTYLEVDLLDGAAVEKIDFSQFDAVMHLAGLAAVGPSFDNPRLYIDSNIGMEINLFEAALRQHVFPKFLIVSSGSLYDPHALLPLNEDSTVLPNSPYAVSKLGQEQMARYYGSRQFEIIIARPFNHFGPGQNVGFIVPDIAEQVIAVERGAAESVLVGNLEAKRDYTDVRDIVRAYRLLIEKGKSGQLYNVCSGASLSGNDIITHIFTAAQIEPDISEDATKMRPSDAPEIYGSHEKITADTGWQPEIPLQQSFADVITDWRSRANI